MTQQSISRMHATEYHRSHTTLDTRYKTTVRTQQSNDSSPFLIHCVYAQQILFFNAKLLETEQTDIKVHSLIHSYSFNRMDLTKRKTEEKRKIVKCL